MFTFRFIFIILYALRTNTLWNAFYSITYYEPISLITKQILYKRNCMPNFIVLAQTVTCFQQTGRQTGMNWFYSHILFLKFAFFAFENPIYVWYFIPKELISIQKQFFYCGTKTIEIGKDARFIKINWSLSISIVFLSQ